jgi:hypothetical protein
MKIFLRLYSVFLFVIFAFALDGCTPKDEKVASEEPPSIKISDGSVIVPKCKMLVPKGEHTVVLLVDTENLKPGQDNDTEKYCRFPDLNPGESIKNYTTDVLIGNSIVWLGASLSTPLEHDIAITEIEPAGGAKGLIPQQPKNGKVVGLIDDNAKRGQEITYKIKFSVIRGEGDSTNYTLDPKILVH